MATKPQYPFTCSKGRPLQSFALLDTLLRRFAFAWLSPSTQGRRAAARRSLDPSKAHHVLQPLTSHRVDRATDASPTLITASVTMSMPNRGRGNRPIARPRGYGARGRGSSFRGGFMSRAPGSFPVKPSPLSPQQLSNGVSAGPVVNHIPDVPKRFGLLENGAATPALDPSNMNEYFATVTISPVGSSDILKKLTLVTHNIATAEEESREGTCTCHRQQPGRRHEQAKTVGGCHRLHRHLSGHVSSFREGGEDCSKGSGWMREDHRSRWSGGGATGAHGQEVPTISCGR